MQAEVRAEIEVTARRYATVVRKDVYIYRLEGGGFSMVAEGAPVPPTGVLIYTACY